MLDVFISVKEGIPRINLAGRFDGLGAQLFEQEVERVIEHENQWLIDFTNVVYLSSAGIRSLMKYGKKLAKAKGRLFLFGLGREVKSVLETTGVLQLFNEVDDLDQALLMINKRTSPLNEAQPFEALERICTWHSLSGIECVLDIWNPLKGPSLQGLNADGLAAASLEDLNVAFGIGGLGFSRSDAFEGLGAFVAVDRLVGVLPADSYNQPDFMVVKSPGESTIYVAAAAGFTGPPWGRLDIPQGRPVNLGEVRHLITSQLLGNKGHKASPVGMLVIGNMHSAKGSYYHNNADLINNRPLGQELNDKNAFLLIGLTANQGWQADEHLTLFAAQHGTKPGEEFFLGNALLFANQLEMESVHDPEELVKYCSNLEFIKDLFIADEDIAISEGRVWLFVPGQIRSGEEKQLQLELHGEIPFPEEWHIITRRLYADARRVILEPLHGGFSPGKPFRVTSFDSANRRMLPTVIKIGPTPLIEKEIQNHQKYVKPYILNNSTTVMGIATCGESTGMRYNFVGISGPDSSLSWLTNRFRELPVENLLTLFDIIFTHILKPWYGQPRWEMIKPYQEHNPLGLFPMIFDAAEKEFGITVEQETIYCPELGITLPNPYRFLKYEYFARQSFSQLWYTGINHGDLNMQNILLDERDNVYIIDFSETKSRNIVSDFARLEPIFKFEMTRLESDEDLISFLEFERTLAGIDSLEEVPPFDYRGTDPAVDKIYQMICRIRKYAKTVVIFETDIIPYLVAMLEWVLPIVVFVNVTPWAKKAATYSAAMIVEQILRLESK